MGVASFAACRPQHASTVHSSAAEWHCAPSLRSTRLEDTVVAEAYHARRSAAHGTLGGESECEWSPCRFEQGDDFTIRQCCHLLGRCTLLKRDQPQAREEAPVVDVGAGGLDELKLYTCLTLKHFKQKASD